MTKSQPFKIGQIYRNVLQDGETLRVPVMLRDAAPAGFCKECQGRGRWTDMNLTCPYCSGSGMISANGDPVDETVSATSNNTEAARGGEFGTDHASINDAKIQDAIARDRAWREATAGSRPGWRVTDAGKEHHTRMNDEYSKLDDERESAYRNVSTFEQNVTTLSKPPTPAELEQIKRMSNDGRTTDQIAQDHKAGWPKRRAFTRLRSAAPTKISDNGARVGDVMYPARRCHRRVECRHVWRDPYLYTTHPYWRELRWQWRRLALFKFHLIG